MLHGCHQIKIGSNFHRTNGEYHPSSRLIGIRIVNPIRIRIFNPIRIRLLNPVGIKNSIKITKLIGIKINKEDGTKEINNKLC